MLASQKLAHRAGLEERRACIGPHVSRSQQRVVGRVGKLAPHVSGAPANAIRQTSVVRKLLRVAAAASTVSGAAAEKPTGVRGAHWQVHKFGGTCMASADRIRATAELMASTVGPDSSTCVVVSAMGNHPTSPIKVTDLILNMIKKASRQDAAFLVDLAALQEKHVDTAKLLLGQSPELTQFVSSLMDDITNLKAMLQAMSIAGMSTDAFSDFVVGHGELWSGRLFALCCKQLGADVEFMDTRDVLVVTPTSDGASVDLDEAVSNGRMDAWFKAKGNKKLIVATGFIARSREGTATTLKRNGSDFSATIMGALLRCRHITIWTDVDGVYSADPRKVPEAVCLPSMTYHEAWELSYFGANVLHPRTTLPAMKYHIPITIRNFFNQSAPGTRISDVASDAEVYGGKNTIKGFATIDNVTLINVEGTGMVGVPGIASRIFSSVRDAGINVIMISQASSEQSICFAVKGTDGDAAQRVLNERFADSISAGRVSAVQVIPHCCVLAAVGQGMVARAALACSHQERLQVAMYNTISQEMRFIPLADRGARALVLAVASSCKYFAAVERVPGLDYDQVSVYSFGGEKRVKSLPQDAALSGSESARVECIDFSENSKFLLTQYGNPDWTLVVWRWYSGKVLARMRLDLSKPVLSAQFSPTDDMLLAVLTPNSVSQLRLDPDSDILRQMPAPPAWEAAHLTSMCWLAGNLMALVGSGGEVYVFQDASARITTRVEPLPSAASASALLLGHSHVGGGGSGGLGASEHLLAVTARGRGFIAAGTSGTVYFFDPPGVDQKRAGIRDLYALTRRLAVELPPGPPRPIIWLSVSAGEEEVAAVTAGGDLYVANMTLVAEREEKPIISVVGHDVLEGEPFRRVLGGFLTGRVMGLAAASSVPLVAAACLPSEPLSARTAAGQAAAAAASLSGVATGIEGGGSAPGTGPTRGGFTASGLRAPPPLPPQLRVWNYESRRCVVSVALEEDPTCLDMHPGGQLVLLGLYDKVAMYCIALEHLDQVYESHIKRATCVRFSNGGGMFAAVGRNNTITLTSTYPFRAQQQLGQLKGHATAVTELAFGSDDRMLVSAGVGGALYFWDLATLNRVVELEHVDKQSVYCGVAMCGHTRGAAVVRCLDGRVQQIANGKVEYEATCKGGPNAPSLMLGADKVYLAADDQGCVVSHAWPGEDLPPRPGFAALAPPPTHYQLHSAVGGGISRMALVPSRGLLFTANGDGTVLMSGVALVLGGVLLEAALAGGPGHGHSHAGSVRPSATNLAGPLAVGAAAGGGALAAPYMVTVPDERLQALRDKVVEVAMLVGSARSEAEYQAFRASQVLRDAITRLEGELAAARAAVAERDGLIARLTEDSRHVERRVVKELEGAHMSAAEELEALYEKRLAVEADKLRVMAAARDDAQYRAEEALRRLQEQHKLDIKDLHAAHAVHLVTVEARMAAEAESRAEQDRFFAEYVKQAEEDFEDHSERINDKITAQAEAAESREQRLKADNNILKRTNLRLKADKTIDLKKMDKLTTDNTALREQAEELKLTIAKLTKELEERDAVNTDNYATIQQLRRKVQDLEKHKFVLSYKAETYAKALEPQEKEMSRLQSELEGHDRELLGHMSKMQVLSRHVAEKDTALRTLKSELAELKSKAGQMEAAINAFSQDLYEAMQQPDDRGPRGKSTRQKALDELVRRYCLGDMRVGGRDEAMEAAANAAAAETRVVLLQWRLEQERGSAKATQRATLHQNSQLLRELQVSQGDLRSLKDRYDAAWVALRELQSKYNLLERRWAASHGSVGAGGEVAREQDAEDVLSEGAGSASVVSMAGRVPPSRPASGIPGAGAGERVLTGVQQALVKPGRGSLAAASTHHTHLQGSSGAKGTRPGSAALARPVSAGWGMYRSVGGQPAQSGLVSRGTPLRAYAELISSERQRMEELAVALAEGSAGLEAQQRALLGLREQLAANDEEAGLPGASWEAERGGLAFGGFSVVSEGRESLDEDKDERGEACPAGRGADTEAPVRGLDAGPASDAALRQTASRSLSTAVAGGRPSTAQPAAGRRWAGDIGSGGSGGGAAASTSPYHAPGLRGLSLGHSHNAKHRPFSARSGTGMSASFDASRVAAALRTRSTGASGEVRASSPSPVGLAASTSPGGGSAGPRRRPTTAAGVGLRAFTDSSADRFRAPGASAEGELPF